MQIRDGQPVFSASDLNNYVECEALTALDFQMMHGLMEATHGRDAQAELVAEKGEEHEIAYLEELKVAGKEVFELPVDLDDLPAAVAATSEAMRSGAEVIYQAAFFSNGWRGYADFLFRTDQPSDLGRWSYEVADTKLARRPKPYFLLQLCFYSEQVAVLQGRQPSRMHVILGTREQQTYRIAEFAAYYRRLRQRFLEVVSGEMGDVYPLPVAHCGLCRWAESCETRWDTDEHLCLVAGISTSQMQRLQVAGIGSLEQLATVSPATQVRRMVPTTLMTLAGQAKLQLQQRQTGNPEYKLLEPEDGRGFALLPPPAPSDVFFDMEGDPFYGDEGLEYLFGAVVMEHGNEIFMPWWGTDRLGERAAFEGFIDFVMQRRRQDPHLHVYHYAHYEPTALKRLAGQHGTRESEVDELLRGEVLVDLYRVVRQSMQISQPSYSIKALEIFYMGAREATVVEGGDSIVQFERWLDEGDPAILEAIGSYNHEDCHSTRLLRDWLLERCAEAEVKHNCTIAWVPLEQREASEEQLEAVSQHAELIAALTGGMPADPSEIPADSHGRWLMAQLLDYHRREARPVWWAFFDRCDMSPAELVDDAESIGELTLDTEQPPIPDKQSLIYAFKFPAQEFKLGLGEVFDPATGSVTGVLVEIDEDALRLKIRRGPKRQLLPLPEAIIPGGPYDTRAQRDALRRLGEHVLADGIERDGPFRAVRNLILGEPPRLSGHDPGTPLHDGSIDVEAVKAVVRRLTDSSLFIQGPPGSGKTWAGARVIVDLIARGERVGVSSNSHKAIHNLLYEIEEVADEQGVSFHGVKKASDNPDSEYVSEFDEPFIESVWSNDECHDPADKLVAGTAWLFSREDMAGALDYLFIDEAGQVSLADAVAMGMAARNVVLLGDPQQLPHVTQAVHPPGAGCSALEHLLGSRDTVREDRGLFLDLTYRLHPEIAAFASEVMYDDRLESAPGCELQEIRGTHLNGSGLRYLPVEHLGNSQSSTEEAQRIATEVQRLKGANVVRADGTKARLKLDEIMVVAPYNSQVACLREHLPEGVRVGTVDKFQGQQAEVVFFSMATSSGEELPRNLEFLFSRNRLNVAVSRARCLAVLVASPRLLNVKCRNIGQMRMVNALCRLVEVAEMQP